MSPVIIWRVKETHHASLIPLLFSEPTCEVQVDLCFIIDSSGSIRDNNPPDRSYDNWELQQAFLSALVDLFSVGPDATRVGAVVFSEQVRLVFSLDTYTDAQSVKDAINAIAYLGQTTNTPEGLRVTREECFNAGNGDRPNVQNLAIFISDGVPYPPERRDPAITEAEALKNAGVSVVAIGVTAVIDEDLLRTISSPPQMLDQNYFIAADFTALAEIRRAVGEGTCNVVQGTQFTMLISTVIEGTPPSGMSLALALNCYPVANDLCVNMQQSVSCKIFSRF